MKTYAVTFTVVLEVEAESDREARDLAQMEFYERSNFLILGPNSPMEVVISEVAP